MVAQNNVPDVQTPEPDSMRIKPAEQVHQGCSPFKFKLFGRLRKKVSKRSPSRKIKVAPISNSTSQIEYCPSPSGSSDSGCGVSPQTSPNSQSSEGGRPKRLSHTIKRSSKQNLFDEDPPILKETTKRPEHKNIRRTSRDNLFTEVEVTDESVEVSSRQSVTRTAGFKPMPTIEGSPAVEPLERRVSKSAPSPSQQPLKLDSVSRLNDYEYVGLPRTDNNEAFPSGRRASIVSGASSVVEQLYSRWDNEEVGDEPSLISGAVLQLETALPREKSSDSDFSPPAYVEHPRDSPASQSSSSSSPASQSSSSSSPASQWKEQDRPENVKLLTPKSRRFSGTDLSLTPPSYLRIPGTEMPRVYSDQPQLDRSPVPKPQRRGMSSETDDYQREPISRLGALQLEGLQRVYSSSMSPKPEQKSTGTPKKRSPNRHRSVTGA